MINRYPGVVYQWTAPYNAHKSSLLDLKELAEDANHYRFRELEELLPQISDTERSLAMRIAVLPSMTNEDNWKALRTVVLDDLSPSVLDSLKYKQVLEGTKPPTYGHPKRGEPVLR